MNNVIYEPKGAALEYSPLACNLWLSCSHKCRYCYAPAVLHKKPIKFFREGPARPNVLSVLENDCKTKYKKDKRPILLCFTCDPYQPHDEKTALTREALEIIQRHKLKAQILTKGGMRAARDFDILKKNNWKFGSTISIQYTETRKKWEPGAASIADRIKAVGTASDMGIYTWVSVEPVINAEEAITIIEVLLNFRIVDFWKIGKINHKFEKELNINWPKFIYNIRKLLKNEKYYIKTDLLGWENNNV
jgi:DNA repair photolyase